MSTNPSLPCYLLYHSDSLGTSAGVSTAVLLFLVCVLLASILEAFLAYLVYVLCLAYDYGLNRTVVDSWSGGS